MTEHQNIQAQRLPAEQLYEDELHVLREADTDPRPGGWRLSPGSVRTFILGSNGKEIGGVTISRKIFGNEIVVERSIVTLMGKQGLILVGEPGTAKSLLSELLAAAISGTSTHTVQGGAGVVEEQIRYGWNYAMLIKNGPGPDALVPGPLYLAMTRGRLMRFEEITRCPTEVQDCLIPVISDRILHIPELEGGEAAVLSIPGFNLIATANLRDRGVSEMSSALKRRFNFETMNPLSDRALETELVTREVNRQLAADGIGQSVEPAVMALLVTVFQELRSGRAAGTKLEPLASIMSTAEAIQVAFSAAADGWYLENAPVRASSLLKHLSGTVIKDDDDDRKRVRHYLRFVRTKRKKEPVWEEFLQGEKWL
ncbi:AAA family ATPase [Desulfonema ishimotonii]|uniref:AAA family ATPase n=1 Tax=Desulfonema ishimotonii TaxID=45657 RepID=A0A401FWV8_9BACT|nr:AAA family ATPase [Desulfonema ishimotonii]GBC61441.1 AAA family ATPase [Desulfonema ishimotonii]